MKHIEKRCTIQKYWYIRLLILLSDRGLFFVSVEIYIPSRRTCFLETHRCHVNPLCRIAQKNVEKHSFTMLSLKRAALFGSLVLRYKRRLWKPCDLISPLHNFKVVNDPIWRVPRGIVTWSITSRKMGFTLLRAMNFVCED